MYLPSFPVQGVIPGFTFPLSTVGRLGYITSPPTQPQFSHRNPRYYAPLRLPLPISGRFAFAPFPIPCCCLRLCSTVSSGSTSSRCSSFVAGALVSPVPLISSGCFLSKETGGSPKFVSYPSMHMPRSPIPVASPTLALTGVGLLPSRRIITVGLLRRGGLSFRTTISLLSGFNVAACALASPLLRTPPLRDRTSVPLLACWLRFSLTGFAPVGQHQQVSMPIGTSQCFTFRLARG